MAGFSIFIWMKLRLAMFNRFCIMHIVTASSLIALINIWTCSPACSLAIPLSVPLTSLFPWLSVWLTCSPACSLTCSLACSVSALIVLSFRWISVPLTWSPTWSLARSLMRFKTPKRFPYHCRATYGCFAFKVLPFNIVEPFDEFVWAKKVNSRKNTCKSGENQPINMDLIRQWLASWFVWQIA